MTDGAFYEPDGDRFASTELTRGPWDPGHQHAGPPAALLGRAIEGLPAERPMQVARVTFEILRPVPLASLEVSAEVVRPGRSVELVEASLSGPDGELMRARAWRLRTKDVEIPAASAPGGEDGARLDPPPGPDESEPTPFWDFGAEVGYHTAMELRLARGSFREAGPATVWMRMRPALVAGEEPSPLARVLAAADSGNGVSWTLPFSSHLFVNLDLSVHLHRMPRGEWVCLDAATVPEPNGIGLASSLLWDERGPIGRSLQTLLVDRRPEEG